MPRLDLPSPGSHLGLAEKKGWVSICVCVEKSIFQYIAVHTKLAPVSPDMATRIDQIAWSVFHTVISI